MWGWEGPSLPWWEYMVPLSAGQDLGAVISKEHPSKHWSLLEQPLPGSLGWGISWAVVSAT